MHIGHRIKEIREAAGMQQKDLAEKVGLSKARMSELEKSEGCPTKTLESVCDALGVTPSYFYSEESGYKSLEAENSLLSLVKEIGIDYLVMTKELKDAELSPDDIKKTIAQLKSLGLLK